MQKDMKDVEKCLLLIMEKERPLCEQVVQKRAGAAYRKDWSIHMSVQKERRVYPPLFQIHYFTVIGAILTLKGGEIPIPTWSMPATRASFRRSV